MAADPSGLIVPVVSITSEKIGTVDASTTCVSNSAECTTIRSSGMNALICDAGTCTA